MYWTNLIICLIIAMTSAKVPRFKAKTSKLVGGRKPRFGEVNYIVVVKIQNSFCGGGIISEKHILTAAHCINANDATGKLRQQIKIIANTIYADGYKEDSVVKRDVARVYQPAIFKNNSINDIAVLELKTPLQIIKHKLQKLNLPEPLSNDSSAYPTYENASVIFAGYGNTRADVFVWPDGKKDVFRSGGGQLYVAKAIINDAKTCKNRFRDIRSDLMCLSVIEDESKQKPQGTCTGDSGSPAVYDNDVVVGLNSRGSIWCNSNLTPTLFTRVSSYIRFIKNAIKGITDDLVVYEA